MIVLCWLEEIKLWMIFYILNHAHLSISFTKEKENNNEIALLDEKNKYSFKISV